MAKEKPFHYAVGKPAESSRLAAQNRNQRRSKVAYQFTNSNKRQPQLFDSKGLLGAVVVAALVAALFESWLVFWGVLGFIFYSGAASAGNSE